MTFILLKSINWCVRDWGHVDREDQNPTETTFRRSFVAAVSRSFSLFDKNKNISMIEKAILSPIHEVFSSEEHSDMFGDIYEKIGTLALQVKDVGEGKRVTDQKLDLATAKIEALMSRFNTSDARMQEIHRQLEMVIHSLPNRDTGKEHGGSSAFESPQSQDSRFQPPAAYAEPVRRELGFNTRENLLKNVDMPLFDGTDTYSWVARVERFFRMRGFSETDRLELVSVSLIGDALSWYNWAVNRQGFPSWLQFKARLLHRFGNLKSRGPSQSLFCIKQTDTVAAYIHQFEDLSSQVTGLDDLKLEGIFLNGLSLEMQEIVHMWKPQNLPEMIGVTRDMESSLLRQVVLKELKGTKVVSKGDTASRSWVSTNSSQWKSRPLITETPVARDKPTSVITRPRKHFSDAELDEKRRKGLCFKCDGRYFRGHICPNKELQVLAVVHGYEMEVLDENMMEAIDLTEEQEVQVTHMALSYSSFVGLSSETTMMMRGTLGKHEVIVMLDSGATHNFITPSLAAKTKSGTQQESGLHIRLGT